jgi:large subunit ribosomal protein L24
VQTTLLGFAIVIILALVTALVGPLFVDWNAYRGEFETRASRLTGLDFHVTGAIEARLLPTPTVMLQGIEFGRPGEVGKVRARSLRIEFALGALARGEWRITDARLEGPEFAAGLDGDGRLAWPVPKLGFDLEGVSIDRLKIEDGRAILADAASGSRLTLDKLEFNGELRSLAGPIKGEGAFVVAGQHYPYRLGTTRITEEGGVKVRLTIDPIDRPLRAEADVSIWVERGAPRFDGSLQLSRPVGRAPPGAQELIIDPWRVSSRIKGDSATAVLDQIEFQYGPDDRPIKLKGSANLMFGRQPSVVAVLSSPQIDLDRVLALSAADRRRPLAAAKALAETFSAALRLPIPTTLSLAVESLTLGGAVLQRVGTDLATDADGLDIKALDFRAPGVTQVRLSGRLAAKPAGVQFEGSTRIDANDPRAFLGWLGERTETQPAASGALRLSGDLTLGSDAVAIDRLKLELDRMTVSGRLAYAIGSDSRPARLDAALTAPEIDFDRVHALAKAIFGDVGLDWPREGTLSLKVARAAVAGVDAKQADVNMRIDANGVEIEQFAIADFGGAALAVKGRIDTRAQSPHGALTVDLDARSLDGILALVDRIAPQAAEQLRRSAGRLTPLTLRAALAVDPATASVMKTGGPGAGSVGAGSSGATAKFKVDGRAGAFRVALQGDAGAAADAFKIENLAALKAAATNVSARLEADDGGALLELTGLDRFIVVDKRAGRLALGVKGPLDGELAIDGQLAVGTLNLAVGGTARLPANASPTAALDVKISNANVRSPRPVAGRSGELWPTSATARLVVGEGVLRLSQVKGTVAGTDITGQLTLGALPFGAPASGPPAPITVEGNVELGAIDLPAAVAVALGIPDRGGSATTLWPAEPFEYALRPLNGQIAVKAARVTLAPKLTVRDFRGALHFGDAQLALQITDGGVAGGRVAGDLIFLRNGEGLMARSRVRLAGANAAELIGDGSLTGRLTLDLTSEGSGMSPIALVGSLSGNGSFMLENGKLARLNPAAFDAVIRAVDQGLPIDPVRVRDRAEAALAGNSLAVPLAEGVITINDGQARLGSTMVRAQGADLALNGSIDLAQGMLDGRLTLIGNGGPGAPANTRPEVLIALKGPVDAPKRSIDVAALASWLALRAVEQQSKKLDVLEGREPPAAPAPSAAPTAAPPASQGAVVAIPLPDAPAADSPTAKASHSDPGTATTRPARTPIAPKPKPLAPATTSDQVQPLPPPVDIRPAPTPRTPRPATTQGATRPPPKPPTPPAPRSLSEILFGN